MAELKGKIVQQELLNCLICREPFSLQQVRDGEYFGDTGICRSCYKAMEADRTICFGRRKVHGYSEEAIECKQFCPDRRVCKIAIQGGLD